MANIERVCTGCKAGLWVQKGCSAPLREHFSMQKNKKGCTSAVITITGGTTRWESRQDAPSKVKPGGVSVKIAQAQVFLGSAPAPSPRTPLLYSVSLKAAPHPSSCPLKQSPPDSSRKALRFATTHAVQNTVGCCHAEHTLFSFFKTSHY